MDLPAALSCAKKACSFLKERTKELLLVWLRRRLPARNPMGKVFLLLFLQKKKTLAFLPDFTSRHQILQGAGGLSGWLLMVQS